MHMVNITVNGTIGKGDTVGYEGGRGKDKYGNVSDYLFDEHLHLQVYHDQDQTYCHTSKDNISSSDSPYTIGMKDY